MKHYFFFLLLWSSTYSQTIKIINAETTEPVPFTSVVFYNSGQVSGGDYANQNGELFVKGNYDSLELSCLGYENKTVSKQEIKDQITLQPVSFLLKEVIVDKKTELTEIGYIHKKKGGISGVGKFEQTAVYIKNPYTTPVVIHSFIFNAVKVKGRRAYRIHLYKKSDKGEYPGDDLLSTDIVRFIEKGTKNRVEIDLTEYNIEMPADGIYAALEGLGGYDKNGNITPEAKNSNFTFEAFQTDEYVFFIRPFFFKGKGWININKFLIDDGVVNRFDKSNFIAPSFGLKIFKPTE